MRFVVLSTTLAAHILVSQLAIAQQPKSGKDEPKIDRITLKKGGVAEGTITKESWSKIEIMMTGGSTTSYKVDEIALSGPLAKIEYWDTPASLRGALADIELGNYQEALAKINSAEESVDRKELPRDKMPRRWWFDPWVHYYRGLCLKELARPEDAVKSFLRVIDKHKDSRFLPEAYEMAFECYGEKGEGEKADALFKKIDTEPAELKTQLKKRAQRQKAEILLSQGKTDEAQQIYLALSNDTDPTIKAEGIAGVIRCKAASKNPDDVVTYCKQVLATAQEPSLLLLASNALGESYLARKNLNDARACFVDSVVRYHPGRGSLQIGEHERALYQLARTYEELAAGAKDAALKKSYEMMAGRTYRELAMEYPSGKRREEAMDKAAKLDKAD